MRLWQRFFRRFGSFSVAVFSFLWFWPGPTHAADTVASAPSDSIKQQVRHFIHEAGEFMERGDRRGAAARLEQARLLWPEPSIDYNLGTVYDELEQKVEAADAFSRFLHNVDRSTVLPERIDDAHKRLQASQHTLGRLAVKVIFPDGAAVPRLYLDGVLRAALPSGQLPPPGYVYTTVGPHLVRVVSEGLREYAVSVQTQAGELRQLDAVLSAQVVGEASLLPENARPVRADGVPVYKRWWFWAAIGGGAALTAALSGVAAAGSFDKRAPGSDLDPIEVSR